MTKDHEHPGDAAALEASQSAWHQRALALANVPVSMLETFGGPLSTIISGYLGEKARQRVLRLIADVDMKLDRVTGNLEQKLNETREDVADQVVRLVAEAARTQETEKLERLRNATANLLLTDIGAGWEAQVSECVREITTQELALLRSIYAFILTSRAGMARPDEIASVTRVGRDFVDAAVTRLSRFGLLRDLGPGVIGGGPNPYSALGTTVLGQKFLAVVE